MNTPRTSGENGGLKMRWNVVDRLKWARLKMPSRSSYSSQVTLATAGDALGRR